MTLSASGSSQDFQSPTPEERELTRVAIELAREQLSRIRTASELTDLLTPVQLQQLGLTRTLVDQPEQPNPEFEAIRRELRRTPRTISKSTTNREGDIRGRTTTTNPKFLELQARLRATPPTIGGEEQIEFTPELEELLSGEALLRNIEIGRTLESPETRDELRDLNLDLLRSGGEATEQDIALIEEARAAALARGESDIERGQRQSLEVLREELAPQLGLRPTDTPILDRGARVSEEALRQRGNLANNLAAQAAELRLRFPLERTLGLASETRGSQAFEEQIAQFQQQLRESAAINRLSLSAGLPAPGLSIAEVSGSNVGGIASATTERGRTGSSFGFGFGLGSSSS